MDNLTFEIIKVIVMAVVAAAAAYVIPFIRAAVGTEKMELMLTWAQEAVRYAEQMLDEGTDKKAKAMEILKKVRDERKLPFTDEQLDILIESAVNAMNEPHIEYIVGSNYNE